jgi:hypothetical protein
MSSLLVFNRVYRLEIKSVMLVFSTQHCELLPLLPSLWFTSPTPPPFPVLKHNIYRQCEAGRGWGALSCIGEHILPEFNILFLAKFRTDKIAIPPQTKT